MRQLSLSFFSLILCAAALAKAQDPRPLSPPEMRARRFLAGRTTAEPGSSAASALNAARQSHLEMQSAATGGIARPRVTPLSVPWQALGPVQITTSKFGNVSGRVSSIAIDSTDPTGNTVYLGTTGGGVWKSTNAAAAAASVIFSPLTDTLPVFSAGSGSVAIPSLSIGAVSVGNGVLLAGTGDPNDATDSYYGEGILRSADAGLTWTLIQQSNDGLAGKHSFVGLGFAGFAWSTTSPRLVVAAVSQAAEGVIVNAPDGTYSVMGLYYSTDAGVTWQMATLQDGSQIVQRASSSTAPGSAATSVVWNPIRQRFYAAVRFHGYYESSDGMTWTRLAHQPAASLTAGACPTNPNSTGSRTCPIFRGALAVEPGTGDTFALTIDAANIDQGLWQDVCALSGTGCASSPIAFAKQLPSATLELGSGSAAIPQADYDFALTAVANGSDTLLFAGTVDLYRCSLSAGCVFRNTTNAENGCAAPAKVSPAQHAIAALAGAGTSGTPLLFVGNDGGLWRSDDGVDQRQSSCSVDDANHFQNLNTGLGSLAEIVSFAQDPTNPATLLAGLGANGAAATPTASTAAWPQISAGEGGAVAIDPSTPRNWYVSTAAGVNVRYCANGSACTATDFSGSPTIGYAQVGNDDSLIDPPILLDPMLSSGITIGTCRIWRGPAQSGASWSSSNAISTILGSGSTAACGPTSPMLRSLAASGPASGSIAAQNAGSTVLYAGMAGTLDGGGGFGGHLFGNSSAGTATSGTVWTDLAKSPVTNDSASSGVFNPGGFDVSSIVMDPHDPTGKTLYATIMGFAGNGVNAPHLYRSTDAGAHWINISSNLPNAPANGVAVDPNDANTLYIAMDTGLYVTTQVLTCSSANCWSVYGTGLPNAPVIAVAAAAAMPAGDGRFGELRVATYGRGLWQIPLLTAAYPAAPAMTLSPLTLTFATQPVATASAAQTILVTNSGNAVLNVSQIIATGDFAQTNTCIGSSIATGATCSIQISFLPTATGTRTGVLTVYGNVPGGQASASLTGTGAPPAAVVLNPIAVTFPTTRLGATSAAQNITVSNTGGLIATLQAPSVSGDFIITANTCGASLASGVGCTVSVAFAPTAAGTRNGTFSVTGSAGTQTASLTGTGQLAATDALTPTTLTFASQQMNTASATQPVTLTNTGDATLTLINAQITGGDFTVVNACGNSLAGRASCSLLIAFVPKSIGPASGILTVTDEYRSQTITLNGTGVAPAGFSLSPTAALSFAATGVGTAAAPQTITLTNNGGMPLLIQSLSVAGDFSILAGTNTCGATLAIGTACTAQISFTPTGGGLRNGLVTIVDNAASSPQTLQLTGTGIDFALAPNGSTTATVSSGSQAIYPLLLTSATGVPGTVSFTCAPLPAHATCTVSPSSPGLGATTAITVTIATSVAGAELRWPQLSNASPLVFLAAVFPFGLFALKGRQTRRFCAMAVLTCTLCLTGCTAARLIPATAGDNGPAPTPSGTYNLTVTGTSAGLSRSVALTLIVK